MRLFVRSVRSVGPLLAIALCLIVSSPALGQVSTDTFVTGAAAEAWGHWHAAMKAILARDKQGTEDSFGLLLEADPSPFRIALLAERTISHTSEGGAVLLLEQDFENDALEPNAKQIAEMLETGRERMNQADDGWYFTAIGRFDVANANFRALIDSDPDPVALLEFADRVRRRAAVLLRVVDNDTVGESARQIIKLLEAGEVAIKADPTRIKENLNRLGGPPRAFENAVARLKDSGEYAIPFIVQFLRDAEKKDLTQAILRCLPQINRPALNPAVIALRMDDRATKRYLIQSIGKIGYTQPAPYLLQLIQDPETPDEIRTEASAALASIQASGFAVDPSLPAAMAYYRLANEYYDNQASLAADSRLDEANVWYWRDDLLQNVPVPTAIFNEIMCMRCCEEALRLDPDMKPALALWLAANFRREAQLAEGQTDHTRPDNYPSAAYFAQSAGAEYCLLTLARGVSDGDPAVALGAIEALRKTAGPASIVGDAAGRLPLAEALSFPDRMVRIRAALALGNALPQQTFLNHQNLIPVLSEALMLHAGARNALIVDSDEASANQIAAGLRAEGYEVLISPTLFAGLEKVRQEFPGLDVVFIASDVTEPALGSAIGQLRSEFQFAATPAIIITKPAHRQMVRDMVRADHRLGEVLAGDDPDTITAVIAKVSRAVGAQAITPDVGVLLAQESANVLRALAVTNNPVFDIAKAEAALIVALDTSDSDLRITVAQVLGFIGSTAAQEAIAAIALDPDEPQDMRVAMFDALAEAAKRNGNQLGAESIMQLVGIVQTEENMIIRTAASQAQGALNLPGNPASELIRNQYGG